MVQMPNCEIVIEIKHTQNNGRTEYLRNLLNSVYCVQPAAMRVNNVETAVRHN